MWERTVWRDLTKSGDLQEHSIKIDLKYVARVQTIGVQECTRPMTQAIRGFIIQQPISKLTDPRGRAV
jgi:hypothetical protein